MSTCIRGEEETHGDDTKRSKLRHAIEPSLSVFRIQNLSPFYPVTTLLL
jgi:hypothetical protein